MSDQLNRLARIAIAANALVDETNRLSLDDPSEANLAIHASALHVNCVAQYQLGERAGQIVDHEAVTDLGSTLMDGDAFENDIRDALLLAKERA